MIAQKKWQTVVSKLLYEDPRFFVFDTLPKQNLTRFLMTTESALATAPFADIRFDDSSHEDVFANTNNLLKYYQKNARSSPDVYFIFHHAFVCSTLLARCLNQIDAFYALKEPWILRRIADLKRAASTSASRRSWQEKSKMHLHILCKQYTTGKSLVIKPTNVANNLMSDVCKWLPKTKVLYLYSDLEAFLVSNIKKEDYTKAKMGGLLEAFLSDSNVAVECRAFTKFQNLDHLQICAAIWIANIYLLKMQCEQLSIQRVRAIKMDELLETPDSALDHVSRYFGHTPTNGELARMTSDDVLGFHAKASIQRPFNTATRAHEYERVLNAHRTAIESATEWAEPMIRHLSLREFLQDRELGPTIPYDARQYAQRQSL